ncbi:phosphatidylglycerophosphatase A [Segetibacter sp.]|jgi:phosphatidylglycerophosphatase A|uniref:phosphatidylglycerophosphatase A family protein n=1 Tax=Segetibacter sp. TaxID=2231182 RepID=UPI00260FA583|nr:phosphatidylglycerophosphatase A [Segetibacter sp.]MCW3079390.1 phosphatidylglycerophosphatase [Segetibacter sp.]
MIKLHKLIATFFGIGYVGKGGGTVASVVLCLIWLIIPEKAFTITFQIFLATVVCVAGVWSGNVVDKVWGKDSSKVVIDEVAGMIVTLIFLPVTLQYVLTGLVLFRFFDIAKPLFIKKMEALPKGWGVMADDVLAGLYAHALLMVIVECKLF